MALSILNNVSSMTAENALSNTQANLQKTLTQLSTGMKINSGSDDAAGLSIVSGLNANIAALTQSQQNASDSIGMLQTADGALSQVTTLLNRAVTLATEGATSGITQSQATALQTEYTKIASEIDQIGQNTNFNGQNVFSLGATSTATGSVTSAGASLTSGDTVEVSTNNGANIYTYTAGANSTVQDAITAINENVAGATAGLDATNHFAITSGDSSLTVTLGGSTTLGANGGITNTTSASSAKSDIAFISDGSSTSNTTITTAMSAISSTILGVTGDLTSTAGASAALTALVGIDGAINTVSQDRGTIGASVNRLTAAQGVMSNQVTNLQSAANSLENADIGKTVANMTQYNVLQSTGMAALQQSNQAQQAVLKLVQ